MPVAMSILKKPVKNKQLKAELSKELNFIKNVFSFLSVPQQLRDDNDDMESEDVIQQNNNEKDLSKRARSIAELEEKLEKIKSQNNFSLKSKLVKKSLNSKLNKKLKKRERLNKEKVKPYDKPKLDKNKDFKSNITVAKPVFNTDGKLVFSKFDFADNNNKDKVHKGEKDPRRILENLQLQKDKIQRLEESEDSKAKEIKEKVAWKSVLQKAEGQKVKDDPTLLKKSIKRQEQKKKQSKKQWETRIKKVEQKKDERQKKRKENINKKKKEKKSKIVKTAVKRGRVVI